MKTVYILKRKERHASLYTETARLYKPAIEEGLRVEPSLDLLLTLFEENKGLFPFPDTDYTTAILKAETPERIYIISTARTIDVHSIQRKIPISKNCSYILTSNAELSHYLEKLREIIDYAIKHKIPVTIMVYSSRGSKIKQKIEDKLKDYQVIIKRKRGYKIYDINP